MSFFIGFIIGLFFSSGVLALFSAKSKGDSEE